MVSIIYNPTSIYVYITEGECCIQNIYHSLHNIFQYPFSLNFNLVSEHYIQKSFHRRLPLLLMDSTTTDQPSSFPTANMSAAAFPVLPANSVRFFNGSSWIFCVCIYSFYWLQLSSNNGSNTFLYTNCFGTARTPLCSINCSQHTSSWCCCSPSLKYSSGYLLETDHQ